MIARPDPDDPRVEVAAEAHHAAKIALGLNVKPWRDLPTWQRYKQLVSMAAALRAADAYEAAQRRKIA